MPNHFRLSVILDRDIPRGGWLLWVFIEPTVRPFCSLFVHLTKPQLYSLRNFDSCSTVCFWEGRSCPPPLFKNHLVTIKRREKYKNSRCKLRKLWKYRNNKLHVGKFGIQCKADIVELATYENRVASSRLINESLNKNIYSLLLYQFLESQQFPVSIFDTFHQIFVKKKKVSIEITLDYTCVSAKIVHLYSSVFRSFEITNINLCLSIVSRHLITMQRINGNVRIFSKETFISVRGRNSNNSNKLSKTRCTRYFQTFPELRSFRSKETSKNDEKREERGRRETRVEIFGARVPSRKKTAGDDRRNVDDGACSNSSLLAGSVRCTKQSL